MEELLSPLEYLKQEASVELGYYPEDFQIDIGLAHRLADKAANECLTDYPGKYTRKDLDSCFNDIVREGEV